jgi:hypothetical protein
MIPAGRGSVDVHQFHLSNFKLVSDIKPVRFSPYTAMFRTVQFLYLLLPAFPANMAPPFVKYWPAWNRPTSAR